MRMPNDIRKDGDVAGGTLRWTNPCRDRAVALEPSQVVPLPYHEIVRTLQDNPDVLTRL